jgi:hypothetical protein
VEGAAGAEALGLRRRAVDHLLRAGYLDEGMAALRDVLREVGIEPPATAARSLLSLAALEVRLSVRGLRFQERPESAAGERALVRVDACAAAATGLGIVNPFLAAEAQARHLLAALELGEPYRVARALCTQVVFSTLRRGTPHPSIDRLLSAARAIAERMDHPHLLGLTLMCSGMAAAVAGQWRRAHELLVESESILRTRCTGVFWEIDTARLHQTLCLWMLGAIDELRRFVPALCDEARERGNLHVETSIRLIGEPLCALAADQPARASEAIAASLARWPRRPGTLQHLREAVAEVRIALYEGRGSGARTVIDGVWPALLRGGLILAPAVRGELRFLRALAALALGDAARAEKDARALARQPIPWTANGSLVIQSGVAWRRGDRAGAIGLLERAERRAREQGVLLIATAMARRLGEWSDDASRRERADAWMTARGVARPERLTAMLLGERG